MTSTPSHPETIKAYLDEEFTNKLRFKNHVKPSKGRPRILTDAYHKLQFGLILNSWLAVEPFFLINGLIAGLYSSAGFTSS
ncbi:hypothetical protein CEXT_162361 [Caerostris extrusa]|uniref:Uncharacterized protein n=1 Tax=Caerostris extrusa TaxID=172846 RepID=A0AAV4TRQ1_CAEEX|nr:hypothetical protein CEXT_162361 [Caerostris extrusa]